MIPNIPYPAPPASTTVGSTNTLQSVPNCGKISVVEGRERVLLMTIRQALVMILGALEDYMGMERSIIPKSQRI
jgi:hypothetical protein